MGKGIFFTLLFGVLLLLMLSLIVFYASELNQRERLLGENKKFQKYAFIADDVATDLLSFMKINTLQITRNSTHATIIINETFPVGYGNAQAELQQYDDFIEKKYAQQHNLKGKLILGTSAFSNGPFIFFGNANFNYTYPALAKQGAFFRGRNTVRKYSFFIENATSEMFEDCGWSAIQSGELGIEIKIVANNCPLQQVSVNPNLESRFWANTSGGKYLNITFGAFGPAGGDTYSAKLAHQDIKFNSVMNVTFEGNLPAYAWIPADLEFVGDYKLSGLMLTKE